MKDEKTDIEITDELENEFEELRKFKSDFEGNLEIIQERLNKRESLLQTTEKERINLLKENLGLKKELGELRAVRDLMISARIYGYQDLIKQEGKNIRKLNQEKEK